jgi:acetyltransferase-like isoleucine patch superfamily enzyme
VILWKWLAGLRYKRNFVCADTAVLHETARIINNLANSEAIEIGPYTHVRGELLTFGHGGCIKVGKYCYIGEHSRIWSSKCIAIGDRVLISHNVNIFDNSTHPVSAKKRHEQFRQIITTGHPINIDLDEQPVMIGNDVLIGCMSIILAGVTIGEGAIIGAGSVVTKDIPPYTIAAGNPARIIREIPPDER